MKSALASLYIADLLRSEKPCMVARLGSLELGAMLRFRKMQTRGFRQTLYAYLDARELPWWPTHQRNLLARNAGLFSNSPAELNRFSELMIEALANVDLLGSWVPGENVFSEDLSNCAICSLSDLEPYYHADPWSEALSGKRVLVIHPFADSIEYQYEKNRHTLFEDRRVLPEFTLSTIRAVQSIAGNPTPFETWFHALDYMFEQTRKINYDVAIIGCGAYGFPLASMIKTAGKKAIHLGGATQILFGIKGKRWEKHAFIKGLFNDAWIRPLKQETPLRCESVEGGCYW